jgi:predicted amidophosphoribosyltransferase
VIVYGGALAALFVLSLISFVALAVLRVRARELAKCPYCRYDVPRDARVCRFCLLELPQPA